MARLILGSQSPRRREILSFFSLPFEQVKPDFDEDAMPFTGQPEEYVCALARGKAHSLSAVYPNDIILTADTIVFQNGKIYGKPSNAEEAFRNLTQLVGTWHTVFTGVAVQRGDEIISQAEATRVLFNELNLLQVRHYLEHTQWHDKAGGYAIQQGSGLIVSRIEGCYYNVMGLPINTVHALLKHFHIDLWNFI